MAKVETYNDVLECEPTSGHFLYQGSWLCLRELSWLLPGGICLTSNLKFINQQSQETCCMCTMIHTRWKCPPQLWKDIHLMCVSAPHWPVVLDVVKWREGKPLFSNNSAQRGETSYLSTAVGWRIREEERWLVEGVGRERSDVWKREYLINLIPITFIHQRSRFCASTD